MIRKNSKSEKQGYAGRGISSRILLLIPLLLAILLPVFGKAQRKGDPGLSKTLYDAFGYSYPVTGVIDLSDPMGKGKYCLTGIN